MPRRIRLTERRYLLTKAREQANQKVANAIRPVFAKQFKRLRRFLGKGVLRKKLSKIDALDQQKVQELLKASPTSDKKEWDDWKKALLVALLLGLFGAMDDLAYVENEIWESRGYERLTFDAATLIEAYQYRTGIPLGNIADTAFAAIEKIIAAWYIAEKPFTDLIHSLDRYFNETRIEAIATTEVGNLLAQMVIQQMQSHNISEWYWDAMGENPCTGALIISGVTWQGCSSLNGHLFKRGDPMPPDAAHPNCKCLPTMKVGEEKK